MNAKIIDFRDVEFVLWEQYGLQQYLDHPIFKGLEKEDIQQMFSAALKFAQNEVYPVNSEADREGVRLIDGKVKVPSSFKKLYQGAVELGGPLLSTPEEYGGQGLPNLLEMVLGEMMMSASFSFAMYITHTGAMKVLLACASEEMKQKYLPVLVRPDCSSTMCLTEPAVGSDLASVATRAKKREDGLWEISGTKRFITKGDHDLVDNILHLVLARAEGAPEGLGGISLFIVPKYRLTPEGKPGESNNVVCSRIEEKMGLHASATCELNFGDGGASVGELVGELNQGIGGMFVLMNEARLMTGLQGESLASVAYQHALQYARDRVQGCELKNARDPAAERVAIIKHPDVRRMLLNMKSMVEGMRALIYKGQMLVTQRAMTDDEAQREELEDQLSLLTPVIKAYCSDQGFQVTKDAVQVLGAYGYCREYRVEQYMRDIKIASIYEGTNGIQALDFLGRKVLNVKKQMKPMNDFMASMRAFVSSMLADDACSDSAKDKIEKLGGAVECIGDLTNHIVEKALGGDRQFPVLVASEFLEAFGHTTIAYLLADQMRVAEGKLSMLYASLGVTGNEDNNENNRDMASENSEVAFYQGKIRAASFFIDKQLPRVESLARSIRSGNTEIVDIAEQSF